MSLLKYTAEIVKAYVSRNEIPPDKIQEIFDIVHKSLQYLAEMGNDVKEEVASMAEPTLDRSQSPKMDEKPAVPIDMAVTEDVVICLICGKENKAIKGHLSRTHGIDVNAYRKRFSLPKNFPMVAPSYSARRRHLAIETGLGEKLQNGRKPKP